MEQLQRLTLQIILLKAEAEAEATIQQQEDPEIALGKWLIIQSEL